MAGLTNYYNDQHWSFIFITWNEENGKVIEVAENNQGTYTSYLRENAIAIPDDVILSGSKQKSVTIDMPTPLMEKHGKIYQSNLILLFSRMIMYYKLAWRLLHRSICRTSSG